MNLLYRILAELSKLYRVSAYYLLGLESPKVIQVEYADYKQDRDEMHLLSIVQESLRRILDTDPCRSKAFLTGESGDDGSVSQKRTAARDTVRTGRGLGRTLTNKHFAKVETLCLACKPYPAPFRRRIDLILFLSSCQNHPIAHRGRRRPKFPAADVFSNC